MVTCAVWLTLVWGCATVTAASDNMSERLRARIAAVYSHFLRGEFEAYVAMWSARQRPKFRESEKDWQKTVKNWRSFLGEKPTVELLDFEIDDQRARVRMRASALEKDGSRSLEILYDYWVFENGDWFLDDAGGTQ